MAISIASITSTRRVWDEKIVQGTLDFDASYPDGGYPFGATERGELGLMAGGSIHWMETGAACGYVGSWDEANQKLIVMYADYSNASDGPLIPVPGTTNLASITGVVFRLWGW